MAMRCLLALAMAMTPAAADHPIEGVISLLQRLEVQAKEEGAAEAASFQKFTYWCKTSSKSLTNAINKEKKTIASLADKIDGLEADILTLGEDIEALGEEIKEMTTAAEKAKEIRESENNLYKDEQSNFDSTIGAVEEAISAMQGSKASLIQEQAVEKATTLLAAAGKPAAKTYTFKSGGIIETFKGLQAEFEANKLDSTTGETNKLNAYNLAKQSRDGALKAAEASKKEKEDIKGGKESDNANAKSDKTEQQNMLNGDTASLETTNKDCMTTTQEWEERSAIRDGEIKAVGMAIQILGKVTDVRDPDTHEIPKKALMEATARVERDTAVYTAGLSFLQVEDPKAKAVNLLKTAAKAAHSKSLEKLAQAISTFDGPFDKIKQMIQKMIFRLMSEQKDEDDHKNWCDLENEKSTESATDKSEKMDTFKAKINEMNDAINLLVKQITDNNKKAEDIQEHKATETQLREENHAEIVATVKDSQDAQAALASAISVLKDFYKSSGMIAKEPWEFVQIKAHTQRDVELPAKPETWGASYTGTSDPKNGADGVLTLLDETMNKFSSMEADAKVQDETDQKNYDQDMAGKTVELAETTQDTSMKTSKKDSLQQKMEAMSGQLKHTTSEHDAVEQYLKDLVPACGEGDSSYDDRKKARADEITALRKAQTILEDAFRAK